MYSRAVTFLWRFQSHKATLPGITLAVQQDVKPKIFYFCRHELTAADYISSLPKGKHSTKGVGMTNPDPKDSFTCPDGTIIPLGKGCPATTGYSSLLYNEYIVYDVAQVNIKYLLQVKFNYKW